MYTILVVDDEKDIVSALEIYLKAEGYRVLSACNGKEALAAAAREDVHLILMDIMMPVMDGLSAMAQLRQTSNVPVILLTAKGEDTDKVLGLNVGADDYITKPFNPVELLARVRSQLRRYLQLGGGQVQASTLIIGGICLDDNAKTVTVDGDPVALTPKEYDILRFLMRNAGTVFSPNEIYRRVWEDVPQNPAAAIAVHLRQGLHACGTLQRRVERSAGRDRQYGGGTHPPSAGKAGDQPLRAPVHQGGLGQGL